MSEPNDTNQGGWQQPQTPGGWRQPEDETGASWRRIPALPTNLSDEPEEEGGWHRPDAEDTLYKSEDTIDIAVSPEDELLIPFDAEEIEAEEAQPHEEVDDILPPEDMILRKMTTAQPAQEPEQKALLAPEDMIEWIEHSDDEPESVGWSELVALASLAEEGDSGIEHGADSPISAELALAARKDEDSEELNIAMLSPAERLMMGEAEGDTEEVAAEVVDEDDPAAYARRQMEELLGGSAGAPFAEATDTDDPSDPAAYARRQMEELLGGSAGDTGVSAPTQSFDPNDPAAYARQQLGALGAVDEPPLPVEELSPREEDLIRRYRETEAQVQDLRQQAQMGQITQDDYVNQLRNMMVLDDDQNWWMMGVETDQWYKAENGQWVEATPEVFLKQQRIQQATGGQTGFSGDFGSLPYLSEQPPSQATQPSYGEYSDTQGSYNNMPLPRQVPIDDDGATVPSRAVRDYGEYEEEEPPYGGTATIPSAGAAYGGTVMAEPVGYGRIESPYDSTEPPPYEYDEDEEGELYEKARERARRSTVRGVSLVATIIAVLFLLSAGGFVGLSVLWYQNVANEWELPVANLATAERDTTFQAVVLLDRNGQQIAELSLGGDVRRPVTISEVSPHFIHAILTLNDPDFYAEESWSFGTRLGAFWSNTTAGSPNVEASPITLEIARNLILRDRQFTTDAERRLHELVVANELTQAYTRAELLEFYINDLLFFGNQNYGVEAATRFYFEAPQLANSAAELNYAQAALLATVAQSPIDFDPIANRERALDQMAETMRLMTEVGCIQFAPPLPAGGASQLCVSEADFSSASVAVERAEIIRYIRRQQRGTTTAYPHFVTLVQTQLETVFGNEIYRRGYRVTTSLDRSVHDQAEDALRQRVGELRANGVDTGAIVVTDPRTGAILALVGSPDFDDQDAGGSEDKSRTYRTPGDIIKPIIYAMAFEGVDRDGSGTLSLNEYITPATILWDVPTAFPDGTPIQNFGGSINGAVSARLALGSSLNIPAVKLLAEYGGADAYRRFAESLGVRFPTTATFDQTTALGRDGVLLYDMMRVYGVIANNGNLHTPFTIESIVDADGNSIPIPPELRREPQRVMREEVAYLLQSILSDDNARRLRFPANSPLVVPNVRTGAVTGTSDNSSDLWTIGFSTNRVVGVWLGNNAGQPVFNDLTGFNAAAPLWNQVMRTATQGTETGNFQRPANVVQAQGCIATGTVPPGDACPEIGNVEFISSRRPPAPEQGFLVSVEIDTWSGLIANANCPENRTTRQFVNISDPTAISWLNNTQQGRNYAGRIGLPIPAVSPPTQACDANVVIPVARIASPQGSQTVEGDVQITGQVGDAEFSRYEVQFAPAGTENFQTITTSTSPQPNANSTLATWDTTSVDNGRYTIRLAVFASNPNNGFVYRTVSDVIVNNPEPTPTPVPTETPTPFPTETPFPTPIPAEQQPPPAEPLPFDETPIPPGDGGFIVPPVGEGEPTPTLDPLG